MLCGNASGYGNVQTARLAMATLNLSACSVADSCKRPYKPTRHQEIIMKNIRQSTAGIVIVSAVLGLSGCSGMSTQTRNTAIGAGVGGVAGSVLTNGSTLGTVGGAAAGGLIGNQVK
jgi:osmotically inducible lipoprotein OsmB